MAETFMEQMPEEFVVQEAVGEVVDAEANGETKLTPAPNTGLPKPSATWTVSAFAKFWPICAVCGVPLIAAME